MFVNESSVHHLSPPGHAAAPVVYVSTSAAAHGALAGLDPERLASVSLVAGNRPHHDLLVHPVRRPLSLQQLVGGSTTGAGRRFAASVQQERLQRRRSWRALPPSARLRTAPPEATHQACAPNAKGAPSSAGQAMGGNAAASSPSGCWPRRGRFTVAPGSFGTGEAEGKGK
ncbi:unnamed protein product [Prorocentrum cordatum]|uniref:Uncharacterized protein n=1 Tax=Prorocentrum cordatum TaxID=2364126 RepID=A0ABN9QGS2_9DINO|nr:unnamed protein product [Polarella glacialis]